MTHRRLLLLAATVTALFVACAWAADEAAGVADALRVVFG